MCNVLTGYVHICSVSHMRSTRIQHDALVNDEFIRFMDALRSGKRYITACVCVCEYALYVCTICTAIRAISYECLSVWA